MCGAEILENWPLFGSSFFAVSRVAENREAVDHILALNRGGVHFLDSVTHVSSVRGAADAPSVPLVGHHDVSARLDCFRSNAEFMLMGVKLWIVDVATYCRSLM